MARHLARLDSMIDIFDRLTTEGIKAEPVFEGKDLFFEVEEFDDTSLRIGWTPRGLVVIEDGEVTRMFRDIENVVDYAIEWVLAGMGEPSSLAFL